MRSGGRARPERKRQHRDTVNLERGKGGAGADHVSDRIVGPDFVEVDMGPVDFCFCRVDPRKNPASRRKHFGGHNRACIIEPLEYLVKRPVYRGGVGIHFRGPDPGPGHGFNRWFRDNGPHRGSDTFLIGPAVEQGSCDHVTASAVERVKNKDSHLQYL
jgi:hypothetical protein